MKYNDRKHGRAEYGSYVQISKDYYDALPQEPLSALDLKEQQFARMVHITNTTIPISGDITVPSGESANQTPGEPAVSKITQIGGIAEETIPVAVEDGDAVAVFLDLIGRHVSKEYNFSEGTANVSVQNQALLARLGPVTNLNAVTGTGAGSSVDVSNYHNFTVHIVSSSTTSGATIEVEDSIDGVNWVSIAEIPISVDDVTEVAISQQAYKYLRTSVTEYFDGTYSTYIYCGN